MFLNELRKELPGMITRRRFVSGLTAAAAASQAPLWPEPASAQGVDGRFLDELLRELKA
jgi:hypothetical protein